MGRPQQDKLYAQPMSFMGTPVSRDLSRSKAAVLGVPFDCGTHPVRIGSRLGPSAIREQSALVRPYQPELADYNPLARLGLVDCGDVRLTPSRIEEAHRQIEAAVGGIVEAGAIPVTMGGDGSVTLPQLRAVHSKYPDLVVLHIDAHTDAYPDEGYNTATTFTRAAEEGVLDVANSIHLGARGSTYMPGVFAFTRQKGYQLISMADLGEIGYGRVIEQIHEKLAGRPVYLCFDMDFFDPSCAPGVCTPTWGGASAREGLDLLHALKGLNFVAFDVNTVSPPQDLGGMTAFLAATVMYECLILACAALGLDRDEIQQ
jgi:guanidinobutyrase